VLSTVIMNSAGISGSWLLAAGTTGSISRVTL
jgi:hypothetical protein